MKRFAFYGRVSTEDQQDPTSSKDWQLSRSTSLIEPTGGVVVAEYFDIGQSRSLPWKRRPESARLLADLARPDRGFDAVVIGEPARAFSGNQFGLTFPVFVHYGVGLWVPEVGGAVDPGSEAHDLVMSLYGGMSKGERNRIKIRVRTAMTTQAAQGRFLGGRPPYGYRLADAGPHPNPGKAAVGQRAHRLEPDPVTAPMVQRIYAEYLSGFGLYRIAEGLTGDGVPCPSASDPERNRHRDGIGWSKAAIRVILRNPRYTGREVWNRQRRDEILVDVEDVALGHHSKQRWNDESEWVFSDELAHEAIIDVETFARAQSQISAGRNRPAKRVQRRKNTYALRGLMRCGVCGRLMQGNVNHGRAYYRCRTPREYALANNIDHPAAVYVREEDVTNALDQWFARLADPGNIDDTVAKLTAAQGPADTDAARVEAARRTIAECDKKTRRLVDAIESGSPAQILGERIKAIQGEKLAAEQLLAAAQRTAGTQMTESEVRELVGGLDDLAAALADADGEDRLRLYNEMGLELTLDAERRVLKARCMSRRLTSVSEGGLEPPRPCGH